MIISMSEQARQFLQLVLAGMAAGAAYDSLRIARRIIHHGNTAVQAEDIIYWLLFAMGLMALLLWQNNGIMRFFCIAAPLLGMSVYFFGISSLIFKPVLTAALLFKRALKAILHMICLPLAIIGNLYSPLAKKLKKMLYIFNKNAKKLLKNQLKCATINNGFFSVKVKRKTKKEQDGGSDSSERQKSKKE